MGYFYFSVGTTKSIAANVASFHFGIITVTVSQILALKCVTAAVNKSYVFQSATT
jgi:hypothetical protein